MSYNFYIYKANKALVKNLQKCKTYKDFEEIAKKICRDTNTDINDFYWIDMFKELHDFGSYIECCEDLYSHCEKLFITEELQNHFEDYDPIIMTEEDFKGLLKSIQLQMVNMYEDLLREESIDEYKKEISQLDRLKMNANNHLTWWKFGPADLQKSDDNIVSAWLYEYVYFELVRIYKTFDFENDIMIFMGH